MEIEEVRKLYLAMVVGSLSGNGTMSSPLGGKAAVTHYESLAISLTYDYLPECTDQPP